MLKSGYLSVDARNDKEANFSDMNGPGVPNLRVQGEDLIIDVTFTTEQLGNMVTRLIGCAAGTHSGWDYEKMKQIAQSVIDHVEAWQKAEVFQEYEDTAEEKNK